MDDVVKSLSLLSTMQGGRDESFLQLPPKGRKCLLEFWNSLPLDAVYCNATWDTLYCWPATRAGDTAKQSCATVFSDLPDLLNYPDAVAYRECDLSGSWMRGGWTNYSQCLTVIDHQVGSSGVVDAVRYITFIGALLSLLTLTITIFIFTYYRSLECDRLRVHRNLVVALIVRFLVMLVLTEPFVSRRQTHTYRDVDWLCKTLLALRMYAQMASINWMFVEGLFLHSRLTSNVFDSGAPFTLYYFIGWGAPLVFILAWATTMSLHYPVHCWRAYGSLSYVWILVAPMVTALMMNLLFLINIIRILVTKLRASDTPHVSLVRGHKRQHQQEMNQHGDTLTQHTYIGRSKHQPAHNTQHENGHSYDLGDSCCVEMNSSLKQESCASTHSRESSPLLHSHNQDTLLQQQQDHPQPPAARRHTNSLQHYSSVGYATNRPEFNIRKAIRATVVLFPLLGITNLLFAVNPGDKGDLEGAYMLTNALLQSSQGVFVSVLYCFINSEVQEVLRKRWRQYRMRRLGQPPCPRPQRRSARCTLILQSALTRHPTPHPAHPRHPVHAVLNHGLETSGV